MTRYFWGALSLVLFGLGSGWLGGFLMALAAISLPALCVWLAVQ
jgi:uncharacterized membrane protein YraQ (UPF0718 family)